MTLNGEYLHKTTAEINTQIASYFDIVDASIQMSDTNKRYSINPQSSYSPSAPIGARSYTTVIISPNSDNTADLYNGFITAKMEVTVTLNDLPDDLTIKTFPVYRNLNPGFVDEEKQTPKIGKIIYPFNRVWFGFKDAMDAIDRYEIMANGITIYTQSNAPEESFLTSCCINDTVKKTDIYSKSRHKDIFEKAGEYTRCGAVLVFDNVTNSKKTTIDLKIDIRRFLPLSNIKYLPAFAGKIELRLYFDTKAMVWCPLGCPSELENHPEERYKFILPDITNEFVPIGDDAIIWTKIKDIETTGDAQDNDCKLVSFELLAGKVHLDVEREYTITSCYSVIPCFGIDPNIYTMLMMRYSQQVLTFPTQTLMVQTMQKQLDGVSCSSTQTVTPRFVDSIFFLFPLKNTYRTVYKNPNFQSFQVRCGGYGAVHSVAFSTSPEVEDNGDSHRDPCFIEYCQNAMNVNGTSTGFSTEVMQSLVEFFH